MLLPSLSGNINFWLDGHYSAGITYRGPQDTPILDELAHISNNLHRFEKVCVMVDDIRSFDSEIDEYSSYPSLNILVDWANQNGLGWHIEHDIFVAKSKPKSKPKQRLATAAYNTTASPAKRKDYLPTGQQYQVVRS
jgi:hypothetical protein